MSERDREEKADRVSVVRKLLAKAIRLWKAERAFELYREGKVTLGVPPGHRA